MKRIITLLTFCFCISLVDAQTPALKVKSNGFVGINTADPLEQFDVHGNSRLRGNLLLVGQDAAATEANLLVGFDRTAVGPSAIRFYNSGGGFGTWGTTFGIDNAGGGGLFHQAAGALFIATTTAQSVRLATNNTEWLRVDGTNGNVGIHQTSPTFTLELGGAGTAAKPGGGAWSVASDRKLKKDIRKYDKGLDEVLRINPVVFKYNGKASIETGEKEFVGVIAQEFQKVSPENVFRVEKDIKIFEENEKGFGSIEKIVGKEDYLAVDPSDITYMLVNAIKDQQDLIDKQNEKLVELEKMVENLSKQITLDGSSSSIDLSENQLGKAFISQNSPNPFENSTKIEYVIPDETQSAVINFYNMNGILLKSEIITSKGKGILDIKSETLPSGVYSYTLELDGSIVATKQMIKSN